METQLVEVAARAELASTMAKLVAKSTKTATQAVEQAFTISR